MRTRSGRRGWEEGFTLIEALVALVILAVSTVALLELASQGLRLAEAAEQRGLAAALAASEAAAAGIDYPLATAETSRQTGGFTLLRSVRSLAEPEGLFEIAITVKWPSRRGGASYDLLTYRVDPGLEARP